MAASSCGRGFFFDLTRSMKNRSQPAASSATCWQSGSCSVENTRAEPTRVSLNQLLANMLATPVLNALL